MTRAPGEKSPGGYFGFGGVALTFLPKVLSFFSFLRMRRAASIASLSRCFSARPSRQAFRGGASRSLTCVESAFVLNRRVDLHAIDATPARG